MISDCPVNPGVLYISKIDLRCSRTTGSGYCNWFLIEQPANFLFKPVKRNVEFAKACIKTNIRKNVIFPSRPGVPQVAWVKSQNRARGGTLDIIIRIECRLIKQIVRVGARYIAQVTGFTPASSHFEIPQPGNVPHKIFLRKPPAERH